MEKLTAAEVKLRAQKRVKNIAVLLESDGGKDLMKELKDQFDSRPLVHGDAHQTVIAAAQRDVIHWIEEIIKRGNEL